MATAEARAHNNGLGSEPPAESYPGAQLVRRAKLMSFLHWNFQRKEGQICPILSTFSAQYARGRLCCRCVTYRNVHIKKENTTSQQRTGNLNFFYGKATSQDMDYFTKDVYF